jgi:NAD(P)H-hydrate epimerase
VSERVPPWLDPLYTADQMRAVDEWAIHERGVPSLDLMERAGEGVARVAGALSSGGPIRIVCGKGNNGGDGLVAARKLNELGREVEVLLLWPADELSEDSRVNHERLLSSGGSARVVELDDLPAAIAGSAALVDALLGTGFSGAPRAPLDGAIEAVNAVDRPVIAVDVPSGVDASTGEVVGACVRAVATATFHGSKVGLWVMPGKAHAGRVEVVEIGVPPGAPAGEPGVGLIAPSVLRLIPRRGADSTKFSSGSVLVVGGSTGLTGAACLAAEGAMRAGAGWVRAAVPASLNVVFEQKLTEVMTIPLPDRDGGLVAAAAEAVFAAEERADAVVLGPGLGREQAQRDLVERLLGELERPLLLDADALNALAVLGLESVAGRGAPTVLTPHAGELGRLLGVESAEVSAKRLEHAREAARRAGATVVLKGDDSLVVDSGGRLGVSRGGAAALATAGTGDVLSGAIGAFLAKGLGAFEASCAGVFAHVEAGRVAAARLGPDSVMAGDVVLGLAAALQPDFAGW